MSVYPQLLFVAGPNGAGKSTFSKKLSQPGAVIFDVDQIIPRIKAQSPDMPQKEVYQAATQEFFNQAASAVRQRRHFTLETNFRDEQLMDIVAQFKQHGYITSMIYLALKSIKESTSRVNQRVKNGGHHVDFKNIKQNYDLGLEYLQRFADRFDKLEILDTSGDLIRLRSLLRVQENQLVYFTNDPPEWIEPILNEIAARFRSNDRGYDDDESWSRGRGR
jgi:predicted ABC-type ATPase